MAKANVKELLDRAERLKGIRQTWESYWQDVLYYCIARKAYVSRSKTEGSRLPTDVYNSSAIEALRVFAAGLAGYLTNPSAKWFNLRTENRKLMDDKDVKVWLKDCEDTIYDTLNSSNFNASIHEGYLDFGSVGICVVLVEEDVTDYVRFYTRPIKEIYIDIDERDNIDTLYRMFNWTVRQCYRKWGENCSKETIEKYNKKKYEETVKILHCVEPRYERHPDKKDSLNMPYKSVYIEVEAKHKLSEGGYKSFPYMIAGANKESGEIYFTSPMMECFSDIKMVNRMDETNLRAGMKLADPPLSAPNDGYVNRLNLNPGKVNFRNPGVPGVDDKIYPIGTGGNVPMTLEMIDRVEKKIQRALFVDLFLALAQRDPKMTATEVLSREQERMLLLGPMLGRLTDMYSQGIQRTFEILMDKKVLPPIPIALRQETKLVVDYVSPLAKAQKASEKKSIYSFLSLLGQMAQFNPSSLDKLDFDKAIDELADLEGVNPEIVRDQEEVKQIREARANAEAAAKKIQGLSAVADIAQKGSVAAKNIKESETVGA